jgi:hypothetical protein
MRLKTALALALAPAALAVGAPAVEAASPLGTYPACQDGAQGYETQTWWEPLAGAPMSGMSGHVHLGACLPPLYSTLDAPLEIDALVQLHNNPSQLVATRWSDGSTVVQAVKQSVSCATEQCSLSVPLTIDPKRFKNSGWRELRLTADTRTRDGQRDYNTTRWCYLVKSSAPRKDECSAPGSAKERTGAAGWYSGVEYLNVWTKWADVKPTPKSGVWDVQVKFDKPTNKRGTFDGGFVTVDPHFHADPVDAGMVIPTDRTTGWQVVHIDTTRLANGPHRLFLQTKAKGTKPAGSGSGVFTLPFTVDNPVVEPPPDDPPPDGGDPPAGS